MVDFENTVYVAIDFETTGLRPDLGDRIIEIAAFPIYKGQIRTDYSFYSLVNPEVTIPKEVSHYHKLNNIHIADAPLLSEVIKDFKNYLSDSIIISHNAAMDLRFMDVATKEAGLLPIGNYYADTLKMSMYFLDEGPYNLGYLSKKLNLGINSFHRACDDAMATARLFLKLVKKYSVRNLGDFLKRWEG